MKKFNAFTLAEVLITLGVIGVVAAMTLPVVISNYNKKVTAVRLKKLYTTLSQAIILSEVNNGEHKYWEYGDFSHHRQADIMEAWWNKYLKDYIPNDMVKQVVMGDISLSGKDSYTVILRDGSAIEIEALPGDYARIILRTRYKDRNEGIAGKDYFLIFLFKDDKLLKTSAEVYSNDKLVENCLNKLKKGSACLELILRNGWEIPDNYPLKL